MHSNEVMRSRPSGAKAQAHPILEANELTTRLAFIVTKVTSEYTDNTVRPYETRPTAFAELKIIGGGRMAAVRAPVQRQTIRHRRLRHRSLAA